MTWLLYKFIVLHCEHGMLRSNQLERELERDSFLGVAEEAVEYKVGSKAVKVSINIPDFKLKSAEALKRSSQTDIYKNLIKIENGYDYYDKYLQLIFTDVEIWGKLKGKGNIDVIRVLNLEKERHGRTILEVNFKGIDKPMVLKCIETELKEIVFGNLQTITQQEIMAFDGMPQELKPIFVRKYAHGRLWFTSSSFEVILMEQLSKRTLGDSFVETSIRFQTNDQDPIPRQFVWFSKAFELLHRLHIAGWSHGDIHAENVLWTSDGNELKFIDPERMLYIGDMVDDPSKIDYEAKAIRKLCDIYQLLFTNRLALSGLKYRTYNLRVDLLHTRFKAIKAALISGGIESSFSLDDTIPYHYKFRLAGVDPIEKIKPILKDINPSQYQKFKNPDFHKKLDDFTLKLSNSDYLQKVFIYTIMELNKSMQGSPIDKDDLKFPASLKQEVITSMPKNPQPGQINDFKAINPRLPSLPESTTDLNPRSKMDGNKFGDLKPIQPPSMSGFNRLTFQRRFIQMKVDNVICDLYYSIDKLGHIILVARGSTTNSSKYINFTNKAQMFSDGLIALDEDRNQLFFYIYDHDKSIKVYSQKTINDIPYFQYVKYGEEKLKYP
jgi:hypothetical protein